MKKRWIAALLAATMCCTFGCGANETTKVKLDPDQPVTVTVWHYYNGQQKNAFDQLVETFNETEGRDVGIVVESYSSGSVNELEERVLASARKEVGSDALPTIFASYADTAYTVDRLGLLADLSDYMTEDELSQYVDSFVDEGRIGANGELRIFPLAKATEIFMLNKTDWDKFAAATGATLDQLSTKEGLAETAKQYYEWTDGLTPAVPNDGKAFYGRDAMANLFVTGSRELGVELFEVQNQQLTLHADKDVLHRIWDFYYEPYVQGYFSAAGRFRSDDVKTGEIIALTGSSSSANYFPTVLETENGSYNVDALVMAEPLFEGGEPFSTQQGAGMAVIQSTPEQEYAAVTFLKWFTSVERNIQFSCSSGYLPVMKEAQSLETLDDVTAANGLEIAPLVHDTLAVCLNGDEPRTYYANKAFAGGKQARQVLEYNLSDKAKADRAAVEAQLAAGMSLEEAAAPYLTEESFEAWYASFVEALEAAIAEGEAEEAQLIGE